MKDAATAMGECVICGKPKDEKYKPFCSKRCADVDLNRWFSGGYAIAMAEADAPGEDDAERQGAPQSD